MKTVQKLQKLFFPAYFVRFKNGKFLTIGRFFIYMAIATLIASLRMVYEGKMDINSLNPSDILYLPFLLGSLYHILTFYTPSIQVTEIDHKHWRSQLAFLFKKSSTGYLNIEEKRLYRDLKYLWKEVYSVRFEDMQAVKLNKFIPWLWIAFILISIWLFL